MGVPLKSYRQKYDSFLLVCYIIMKPVLKRRGDCPASGDSERTVIARGDGLAADRVNKMQFAGMQHEPRRVCAARPRQTTVEIAAQDRVPQQLTMDT